MLRISGSWIIDPTSTFLVIKKDFTDTLWHVITVSKKNQTDIIKSEYLLSRQVSKAIMNNVILSVS